MKRSESGVKWTKSGGGWSRDSVRRCSIKKFTVSGRALVLRLSVVISIKVGGIPPTTRVDNIRNLARRHFAAHGHHLFCWPRAIGSRPDYLTFASTSRATHLCSTSMRSEGSAHTLATSTPRNRDSGWSGGKLDWLHQGMQVPKLSLFSSLTALQLPGSGRLPLVRRDGSPHSVKACVRLQCIECLCLPCRRLPGSVLVLLHDMCEDDPRHFSP